MVIAQGEVWWADLAEPIGSAPGYRRPVIILQSDPLNRSQISTVVCVVLTSNLRWSIAPGNVLLTAKQTGLDRDSVANVSQLVTIDKRQLIDRAGKLPRKQMESIFSGVDLIMGR
ncbi:MAG: type II toxin-antitoxin system PemK/MazF family toxin [Pirellulales bacterium]|jgi:mRNA interferase MazF